MIGRAFAVLLCSFLFAVTGAKAQTYNNIHDFCGQTGCTDGANPQTGLIADTAGNLYGTAQGGSPARGVVFELSPNGSGGWTYSVIHEFCSVGQCADGANPSGPLIIDGAGNLYGVAAGGGKTNSGLVYELMPQGGGQWNLAVLRSFCKQVACLDGTAPSGALAYLGQRSGALYDGSSPLYGTTTFGGAYQQGTVYTMTPPPSGAHRTWWSSKILYSFCPEGGYCLTDGNRPATGVVVDSSNVLFGTTPDGGQFYTGTLFKLTFSRNGWIKTLLHTFCSANRCADGRLPLGLVENDAGDLFGATTGGPHKPGCAQRDCGTIFEMAPQTGTFTTLYSFCSQTGCTDGRVPSGPFTMLDNGDLIGVTSLGGDASNRGQGGGVLYRFSGTTLTVLHAFCGTSNCDDGFQPSGAVVVDGKGRIFGTAAAGGTGSFAQGGLIYEFAP
jgi:uncharacterized repeat protein (TIGR03803 family)